MSSFLLQNSSFGWLLPDASPLCVFHASYLQRKLPNAADSALVSQSRALCGLIKLGSQNSLPTPFSVNVVVFAGADRSTDYGQMSYITGLLFGTPAKDSTFHNFFWVVHKPNRPVLFIGHTKILTASIAIEEAKTLKTGLSKLLGMPMPPTIVVVSMELYTSFCTRRNSLYNPIRAGVNFICFWYAVRNVDVTCWLPGSEDLVKLGTKTDSPLSQALQLLKYSGCLPSNLFRQKSHRLDWPFGQGLARKGLVWWLWWLSH